MHTYARNRNNSLQSNKLNNVGDYKDANKHILSVPFVNIYESKGDTLPN